LRRLQIRHIQACQPAELERSMRVVLDRKGAGQLGPGQLWHLLGRTVPGFEGQGHLQRVSGVPGWDDPPEL
jgi:hypothetical protein